MSCHTVGSVSRAPEVRVKAGPAEVLLIAPHERQGAFICQYCGKWLPEGCSAEFWSESGCEGHNSQADGEVES